MSDESNQSVRLSDSDENEEGSRTEKSVDEDSKSLDGGSEKDEEEGITEKGEKNINDEDSKVSVSGSNEEEEGKSIEKGVNNVGDDMTESEEESVKDRKTSINLFCILLNVWYIPHNHDIYHYHYGIFHF